MDSALVVVKADCRIRDDVVRSDRAAVQAIVEATGFFRTDEVAVAVELVDERLAKGPACGYLFVFAEVDGEPVGYACYGPIACTTASYDLYWIAVAPRWQRGGLGRRMMAEVERLVSSAGGERIYIDTSGRAQYAPTRRFYEHNGCHVAARLADFYGPGDDRLIYVKVLQEQRVV